MSAAPWVRALPLFAAAVAATLSGGTAMAQEDFRSLDASRPLKITDAYPKKYLEWEFQFGLQGGLAEGGQSALGGPSGWRRACFGTSRSAWVWTWGRKTTGQ